MEKIFLQLLELMIVIDFSQEKSIFISDLSGQYYFTFPDTCSKYTNKNLDTIIYLKGDIHMVMKDHNPNRAHSCDIINICFL